MGCRVLSQTHKLTGTRQLPRAQASSNATMIDSDLPAYLVRGMAAGCCRARVLQTPKLTGTRQLPNVQESSPMMDGGLLEPLSLVRGMAVVACDAPALSPGSPSRSR